jgi:hypothetical protein
MRFQHLSLSVLVHRSTTAVAQYVTTSTCANCEASGDWYKGGWWTSYTPSTTIEAATVMIIANIRMNTTRTTTIWNLPPNATLPPTNSAGIIIHTKTLTWDSKTITTVLAWLTGYIQYQEGVTWDGTIPVASTGVRYSNASQAACLTAPVNGSFSEYPSLIPPQYPTSTRFSHGGAYQTESFYLWKFVDSDIDHHVDLECYGPWSPLIYRSVYTDFLPYQVCAAGTSVSAASALMTAAYLTVTSTSHEDIGPASTRRPGVPLSQRPHRRLYLLVLRQSRQSHLRPRPL